MSEEKEAGIKPENLGEGGKGAKGQEVGGRGLMLITCWNCGTGNYVPVESKQFICWRCGVLPLP